MHKLFKPNPWLEQRPGVCFFLLVVCIVLNGMIESVPL